MTRIQPTCRLLIALLLVAIVDPTRCVADDAERVLVTVNREAITQADLNWELRGIPLKWRDAVSKVALEQIIDERLIAQFLERRKVTASDIELDARIDQIHKEFNERKVSLPDVLARHGLDEEALARHLARPLAWRAYLRQVVTDEQLRAEYRDHKTQYDGTRIRFRQVLFQRSADAEDDDDLAQQITAAKQVRQQIVEGTLSFEDAAREHSDSPTATDGGDMGTHRFGSSQRRSPVEQALIAAAFDLKKDENSEPITTSAGVHLVQVTERIEGEESLEDARPRVLNVLSKRLWDEQVAQARRAAKIEWP